MKIILKESQFNGMLNEIQEMADKIGYFKTLLRFKLPFNAANIFLKPKNGEYYSAEELTEIMFYYIFYAEQIPNSIEYKNFTIENRESETTNGFYWDTDVYTDTPVRESCVGYTQPFYPSLKEGELGKMLLVCRFDFYTRGDWAEYEDDYIEEDHFAKDYEFDMSEYKFKTLNDAKNWYLIEYPKIVLDFAKDFFTNAKKFSNNSE
jgi:hypothetical protein